MTSISYDHENEIFALGFESGGIKLLRLEEKLNEKLVNQIEIIMNENLNEAHQAPITTLSWNVQHEKLLSLDSQGLMIIWTENEDSFEEEMINQSESDQIMIAHWSKLGNFILILFQSGNMILGNVEGERLWSRKIELEVKFIDWAENDKTIVLSDFNGELIALETASSETFAEYDVSQEQKPKKDIQNGKSMRKQSTEKYANFNEKEQSTKVVFFAGNNL